MTRPAPKLHCQRALCAFLAGTSAALLGLLTACAAPRVPTPALASVRPGLEVLLADSLHLVRGKRVGLVTNQTALARGGRHAIDLLHASPDLELVALFAPEHGIRGVARPGERIESGVDAATGLPIHSLYGDTRKPTPAMLDSVDVLVFDIQDLDARAYTYKWTMALALEAAGEAGIPFVVLDRPVPTGAERSQGNVLDPAFATFVGLHPVPMRIGMTTGELARLLHGDHGIGGELSVVPVQGWRRSTWFDETGLPWVAPSPNMPDLESATHYPGIVLFEGTNLSVGRGTPRAFQQIGAPWLDGEALARALAAYDLPGVRFEAVVFTPRDPGDDKFVGQEVRGVRLVVTDRASYDPTVTAVAALLAARRLAGDHWEWRIAHLDRLAGTDRLRAAVEEGLPLESIVAPWTAERARFDATRARWLLYD
jgi:uncharacterized protein YbbC (DUF1343 family)